MPTFVHPALLGGLLIVTVPVLIHLINMLRHRRVAWAAMEFLLQSQKKNRTRVLLKQLLLLLLRMAAIAAVVLIVARPLFQNQLGDLFGSTKTHHIVLLDDSFSMSDRWADTSAMAQAKAVIERIATQAARQIHPQSFTLLRFSQAAALDRGTQPDLLKEPVDREFVDRLCSMLGELEVSQTAAGPDRAIDAIGQLLGIGDGRRRIVYLISDFRAREWDDPTELHAALARLSDADAALHLIGCVDATRPNLAITSLRAKEGIRAAGVPWFVEVTVQNFGETVARDVAIQLEEDGHGRPAANIAKIPPGRSVRQRFPVHFSTAGGHEVVARLETDAVAADNHRFATVVLPSDVPVLFIDGDPSARDAKYLSTASSPGGPVRTGIRSRIETPRFLTMQPLEQYHAIFLANIERLNRAAIETLEQYMRSGGGVAFFLGENSRSRFINDELHRNGEGLFPLPLAGLSHLPVDRLEKAPDVQVEDHFIFRVFQGQRNTFLNMVLVEQYFAAADGWRPPANSTTRVIARLRNGAPLAVERRFGAGRVVAFLTTAAPTWNNWARNPTFVVAVQDLQAYLMRSSLDGTSHQVGAKLELSLDPAEYRPQVSFVRPNDDARPTAATESALTGDGSLAVSFSETDVAGIYAARLAKMDGAEEVRRIAVNVEAQEGDLKMLSGEELAARLPGVQYDYRQASAFQYDLGEMAGAEVSEWLLYLLVVLLIGEQILAWSASCHPPKPRIEQRGGGNSLPPKH